MRSRVPKRRSVMIAMTSVLFIAAAAAYSAFRTPIYAATARVAVRADATVPARSDPGSQSSGRAVLTEVEVIRSDGVLDLAARKLRLPQNTELRRSLSSRVIEDTQVVEIEARRPDPDQAAAWSNAVAQSYVEFRRTSMVDNAAATGGVISRAIQADNQKLAQLQERMQLNPPEANDLRAEERRLTARVRNLQTQLLGLTDSEALRRGGATIIDLADFPEKPAEPHWPKDLGLAGGAGLAFGGLLSLALYPVSIPGRTSRSKPKEADSAGLQAGKAGREERVSGDLQELGRRLERLQGALQTAVRKLDDKVASLASKPAGPSDGEPSERLAILQKQMQQGFLGLQEDLRLQSQTPELSGTLGDRIVQILTAQKRAIDSLTQTVGSTVQNNPPGQVANVSTTFNQLGAHTEQSKGEFGAMLSQMAQQIVERSGTQREELGQWLMQLDQRSQLRLGKAMVKIDQHLQAIRDEIAVRFEAHEAESTSRIRSAPPEPSIQQHLGHFGELVQRLDRHIEELLEKQLQGILDEMTARLETHGAGLESRIRSVLPEFSTQQSLGEIGKLLVQRLEEQESHVVGKIDSVVARLDQSEVAVLARLEGLFSRFQEVMGAQESGGAGALERVRKMLLEEVREDRIQMAERMAQLNHEMLQRFGKVAVKVNQSLGQLRQEVLGGIAGQADGASTARDLADLKRQIREEIGSGRTEVAEHLGRLERESVQRLGKVAVRMNGELQAIRTDLSNSIAAHADELAGKLESVAAGVNAEGSALSSRLEDLLGQVSSRVAAQDEVLAGALEKLKEGLIDEVRRDRAQIVERMAEQSHEMLQRFAKFASHQGLS